MENYEWLTLFSQKYRSKDKKADDKECRLFIASALKTVPYKNPSPIT
jgi:hypothetical protein